MEMLINRFRELLAMESTKLVKVISNFKRRYLNWKGVNIPPSEYH